MQTKFSKRTIECVAAAILMLAIGSGCTATKQDAPVATTPATSTKPASPPPQTASIANKTQPTQDSPSEKAAAANVSPSAKTKAPEPKATELKATRTQPTPAKKGTPASSPPPAPAKAASAAPLPNAPPNTASTPATASSAPTLDLRSLEQRLRDTHAIGIMTKLSLKNQVDDLLDDFRAFYAGKAKSALADLRQRYDLLLMKVLSVLQDGDAQLASAISSSREAIWGVLNDPKKFAEIA